MRLSDYSATTPPLRGARGGDFIVHGEQFAGSSLSRRIFEPLMLWPAVVVVALFGPYLALGVRLEQVVIYASALLAAGLILATVGYWPRYMSAIAVSWLAIVAVAAVGMLLPLGATPVGLVQGTSIAGMDNILLPVAIIGLSALWAFRYGALRVLRTVVTVLVAMTVLNSGAVAAQFALNLRYSEEINAFLSRFWAQGEGEPVAVRALGNERFTGIFNQPGEAGLMISIAILGLSFLVLSGLIRSRPLALIPMLLLVLSAIVSQSKIALLLGVPIVVLLLLSPRLSPLGGRRWAATLVAAVAGIGALALTLNAWVGQVRLQGLLAAGNAADPLSVLTAGRFGSNGSLPERAAEIFAGSPVFGYGAAGLRVAYDSAWVEVLVVAGGVGLLLFLLIVALFALWLWQIRNVLLPEVWMVATGTLALMVGASLGFPTMTANRASSAIWMLLLLSLLSVAQHHRTGRLRAGP